jgi:hypothetical protein
VVSPRSLWLSHARRQQCTKKVRCWRNLCMSLPLVPCLFALECRYRINAWMQGSDRKLRYMNYRQASVSHSDIFFSEHLSKICSISGITSKDSEVVGHDSIFRLCRWVMMTRGTEIYTNIHVLSKIRTFNLSVSLAWKLQGCCNSERTWAWKQGSIHFWSRYQATAGGDTTDWKDLPCAVVICKVWRSEMAL